MKGSLAVIRKDLQYITDSLREEIKLLAGNQLLITGGAGFLGHYLIQSLLYWNSQQDGAYSVRLTVYDNFIRGVPDWLKKIEGDQNLELVKHDITNPLPRDIGSFQYIIHAASIASPIYYRIHPIETMDANVTGLRILLDYCKNQKETETPVKGFLFFSSSETYGDPTPDNIPTPETYPGRVSYTGPRACYDESKRYGETLCVNFARQYDLPITIVRPFNNYGPGLQINDRRVIPDFARDVLAGRDIVMLSDGAPTRTFCYVADAIVGYFKALICGRPAEAYNIGVEEPEISIGDLAEKIVTLASDLFGYHGRVKRKVSPDKNYLVDNPNRRCPKIDKARNELKYSPGISLEEGLSRSLIWYQDNNIAEEA